MGELRDRGALLTKGVKINRRRLYVMLKILKNGSILKKCPYQRRKCATQSTNSIRHLDSIQKLIHWKCVPNGVVDRYN